MDRILSILLLTRISLIKPPRELLYSSYCTFFLLIHETIYFLINHQKAQKYFNQGWGEREGKKV